MWNLTLMQESTMNIMKKNLFWPLMIGYSRQRWNVVQQKYFGLTCRYSLQIHHRWLPWKCNYSLSKPKCYIVYFILKKILMNSNTSYMLLYEENSIVMCFCMISCFNMGQTWNGGRLGYYKVIYSNIIFKSQRYVIQMH